MRKDLLISVCELLRQRGFAEMRILPYRYTLYFIPRQPNVIKEDIRENTVIESFSSKDVITFEFSFQSGLQSAEAILDDCMYTLSSMSTRSINTKGWIDFNELMRRIYATVLDTVEHEDLCH